MREVSCKALDPFFRAADRRGIARAELASGLSYSLAHLQNRHERVEWDTFRAFMTNVRRHFDDAQLTEIGAIGLKSPGFRSFALIGKTLFSPTGFYRWMLTGGGLGNQMFSNMMPRYRELGPGRFELNLTVSPGYEPCPEFFRFAAGGFQAIPELLGLERAQVKMVQIERGARFDIEFQDVQTRRSRLLKLLTRPMDARATATELNDAMTTLEDRYRELEVARAAIERQRALLDTAYRLGHRIWAEREPEDIARAVTAGLVETADVAGARLDDGGHLLPAGGVGHGEIGSEAAAVVVELAGQRSRGHLVVWPGVVAPVDARTLLDLLAPTVALAIDNASAYRELAGYQRGLERLVEERTAELRQARDALSVTVDQLREAQGTRERIFANISHEIRTPLSLILLAVADVQARAGAHLDDAARDDLSSVVDSARKLLRLVDELLLLASGQETALQVAPVPMDLGRLVNAMVATWRPGADASGLRLHAEVPASLPVVLDPVAIERVLTNLLSNAVKFTPRGGEVFLEVSREADSLLIKVRDTGTGIDDELAQRLFGRFERGRAGTLRAGSGIGLSLVKELVEAHGGRIAVVHPAIGGTEFRVVLPAIETADAAVDDAVPRLRPTDYGVSTATVVSGQTVTPPVASGVTVLVAEDDPALASMISRLLGEEYNVVVALDGLEALALVRQHQPHLLVTDVDMPGMNGIELTRRFREATGDALAPVVILSALSDPGHRLAGLGAGAVDYVVKPFDPGELRARVRSQLGMRDLALRLHRAEQLSALGTLSSGLAHELRNPANGIVNAIGPLKKILPAELVDEAHPVGQLLDVLGGCADQIAFLSRQLLSFRRGGEIELRLVSINDVVQRAATLASPALRGITFREAVAVAEPVRCAPPLLIQVLTNLFENAAHAAGAGGWVAICGSASNGRVTLEISDSGPGVPVELRDRVFEPFFTTKPPGVGTGLGLPLARDIVHRHGGVLEIRERDQRSVFVIELPRAADGA